jgi:hypothetical protein
VGGHVADGGEQFVVDVLDIAEVAVACGVGEDEGGDAFLDGDGAAAIFRFVRAGAVLAFAAEQEAGDGGPAEDGGVGEVESVVKAVVVLDVGCAGEGAPAEVPSSRVRTMTVRRPGGWACSPP